MQNVQGDDNVADKIRFAEFLLEMGNGALPIDEDGYITVPYQDCMINQEHKKNDKKKPNEQENSKEKEKWNPLIDEIFGEFITTQQYGKMSTRVILAPTNEKVAEINTEVLQRMEENEAKHSNALRKKTKVYLSVNQVDKNEPENVLDYPPEYLHSLNKSGLPPHALKVMKNCPVMLLRNMNPDARLCNGIRMLIEEMGENILKCILLTGERKGEKVLIPKITLTSGDGDFAFKLYRKQFPVKVCYAMTINKSQGQTIDYVGVDLSEPVFTHGQKYVAFSRVKSPKCLKVLTEPGKTNKVKNVVWPEALLDDISSETTLTETPRRIIKQRV